MPFLPKVPHIVGDDDEENEVEERQSKNKNGGNENTPVSGTSDSESDSSNSTSDEGTAEEEIEEEQEEEDWSNSVYHIDQPLEYAPNQQESAVYEEADEALPKVEDEIDDQDKQQNQYDVSAEGREYVNNPMEYEEEPEEEQREDPDEYKQGEQNEDHQQEQEDEEEEEEEDQQHADMDMCLPYSTRDHNAEMPHNAPVYPMPFYAHELCETPIYRRSNVSEPEYDSSESSTEPEAAATATVSQNYQYQFKKVNFSSHIYVDTADNENVSQQTNETSSPIDVEDEPIDLTMQSSPAVDDELSSAEKLPATKTTIKAIKMVPEELPKCTLRSSLRKLAVPPIRVVRSRRVTKAKATPKPKWNTTETTPTTIGGRVSKRHVVAAKKMRRRTSSVAVANKKLARPLEVTHYFTQISAHLVSNRVALKPFLEIREQINQLVTEAIVKTQAKHEY